MFITLYFKGRSYAHHQSNLSRNCRLGLIERFVFDDVFVWTVYAAPDRHAGGVMARANDAAQFGHIAQFNQTVAACF